MNSGQVMLPYLTWVAQATAVAKIIATHGNSVLFLVKVDVEVAFHELLQHTVMIHDLTVVLGIFA